MLLTRNVQDDAKPILARYGGLPAILTPNTGANDFIQPGLNGEVVPIRDLQAIADAVFKRAEIILSPGCQPRVTMNKDLLTFEHFERTFTGRLFDLKSIHA